MTLTTEAAVHPPHTQAQAFLREALPAEQVCTPDSFTELANRAAQLALANEIARRVSAALAVPDLLETILSVLRQAIPCDRISIALLDPHQDTMVLRAVYDPVSTPGGAIGAHFPFDPTVFTSSQGLPRLILEPDLRTGGGPLRDALVQANFHSRLSVPIAVADTPLGMVTLARRHPSGFHADECELLQWVAPHLAVALRNAQLYQERQDALDTLARTQEQLIRHERLRAMGELASGVAHDFNNLLTVIIGTADLALLDTTDPALMHDLELIRKAANDGSVIVRRLQSYTRQHHSEPSTFVQLNQLAADAIALTRPYWRDTAQQLGITITINEELSAHAPVCGVVTELREALTNLLINAIQAMPAGGTVTIRTLERDGAVGVAIHDTGVGIPAELLDTIFDPFFTTKGLQGSGLGLALVAGILERHNGTITVESTPGQGSTFMIWLPKGTMLEDPVIQVDTAPMPAGRVLVVDDEPAVRVVLARLLTLWGLHVTTVANGTAALNQLSHQHYNLVFSDLGMAGMNGWELLAAVKQQNPKIRTFLVTGWGEQIEARRAQRRGADHVIAKPFQQEELRALVQAALVDGQSVKP